MTYAPSEDSGQSSLTAWRFGSIATLKAHSEDFDQVGWMPRLICAFGGCTGYLRVVGLLCSSSYYAYRIQEHDEEWQPWRCEDDGHHDQKFHQFYSCSKPLYSCHIATIRSRGVPHLSAFLKHKVGHVYVVFEHHYNRNQIRNDGDKYGVP